MIDEKLIEQMQYDFLELYSKDGKIRSALNKTYNGTSDYKDVDTYAMHVGAIREKVILKYVPDISPEDYAELGDKIVYQGIKENYDYVCSVAAETQLSLNKKANLGLNSVTPKFNQDKADGIVTLVKEAVDYKEVTQAINQNIETYSKGVVSDFIHANADFQYNSGLSPVIHRIVAPGCCDWCSALGGTYEYKDVKNTGNDIYRFHANCKCQIVYDPRDGGRRINTKTQKEYSPEIPQATTTVKQQPKTTTKTKKTTAEKSYTSSNKDINKMTHAQLVNEVIRVAPDYFPKVSAEEARNRAIALLRNGGNNSDASLRKFIKDVRKGKQHIHN